MHSLENSLSRRALLQGTAAVAASSLLARPSFGYVPAEKPNSRFNGVQIGVITYSYRSLPSSAEEILQYVTQCGISSIELMGDPAERFAGAPEGRNRRAELLQWRLAAPMDRYAALRTMYEDAGVKIHIVKFGDIGNADMPDEQIEYYFSVAKTLGAKAITRELSDEAAKRLGPIADRHQIKIAFHNHTQLKPTTYDGDILSYGECLGINLDIGHYVAGTNESPIPLIEKHRDRIVSLHIKDRKVNGGPNMPFGEGDTPLALTLHYLQKHHLDIPADIELEYKIPEGSDAVREVTRCVKYCEQVLA